MEEKSDDILYIGFNQDFSCFSLGTQRGFKILNTYPFKDTFKREFDGGIGIVEMLFRCNILALVGGGKNPKYPLNKVMLWDDHQLKCIGELSFKSNVKAVKLRKDKVVVVLEQRIYVYNFSDLKLIEGIDTISNPKGLCALSIAPHNAILACPGTHKGIVRLSNFETQKSSVINAHESSLAYLALNPEGLLLATASDKGTLVRLFNTKTGQKVQQVRRGMDRAEIYSLAFSPNGHFLACTSDKGTTHIYVLNEGARALMQVDDGMSGAERDTAKNPKSVLSFMKKILPKYFDSEWSFAQFRVPDAKTICAFTNDNHIIGNYYLAQFDDKNGGECKKTLEKKLLEKGMSEI